ncbi:MAG: PAS domain S-box protein, partial [SAR324 cluster bacterium]|nr:PAS domain S-box protein [SAR324 cluster bacterium]
DKAIHFHKIFFDPQRPARFLGIINEVSFQELLSDTKMVRYQTRGTSALLVLIGMVLAYFVTRQMTRPLTQLAISADLVAKGDYQVSLPDNAVGEIRILTTAFKVMIQQIAERSQKLVENENRIKAVLETAADGILVINEKGIIESVNSSAKKIFGYSEDEMVGKNVNMLMPSPYHEAHDSFLKRYLDTHEKRIIDHGREVQGLRKNGAVFPLDLAVSEVKLENIHQFTGIVRDISDRKQVEEDLRKRSQAIEQSGSTIVITDLSGKIEYVNPAFSKITGYSSEEALSQNPRILKSGKHSAAFYKEMWGRLSNGDAWRGELTNKKKSGELYTEYATISPVKDLAGKMTHFVAVKDDISMRKQMELDLINAKELAEQASQTKSDFLANMSHEIRTPMNAILGLTHLCLQTDLTGKQNDYLTKVHSSASALLRIINDILDFSKIEAGKIEMEAVDFNLDDVFEHISNSISTKAQGGELEFLIHSPTDLPKFLVGDPLRLGQILLNLASNAVKFTEQGEVVIYTELRRQEKDRVTLQFTVRDTGIGLDAAQIEKLFQSFSQADSSTTRKFGGTGLGLTIVKQFVEMMNGEIRVESEPGRGSSFIFTAVFGIQAPKKQEQPALLIDLKGMPILVVDDNATSREIFQNMLEALGFQVTLSASGEEALQEVQKADPPFELVLMDWKMPGLDGIQTSGQIRELTELSLQPKIILATSFGVQDVVHQANSVMIDGFLFKPVNASILYNTILSVFGKNVAQNPRYANLQKIDPEQLKPILGARILLVEDNEINQQIAREILEQAGFVVQIAENGKLAVEQVQKNTYEAVLMDIQMPVMDGYE